MAIKPLAGYVLVRREEVSSTTASGIILTGNDEKPLRGEILAVGPTKDGSAAQVAVGQTVIFKKYGPTEIDVDGETLLLLEEEDIFAIVE